MSVSDPGYSGRQPEWLDHFFLRALLDRLLVEPNVFYIEVQFV